MELYSNQFGILSISLAIVVINMNNGRFNNIMRTDKYLIVQLLLNKKNDIYYAISRN